MPKQSSKSVVSEQVVSKEKEVVEQHSEENESGDEGEIDNYIVAEQFDLSKFYLKGIEEKLSKGSQYLAFPKYKYGKKTEGSLTFVTDVIKLSKGGIPRIDGEYKKTDGDRMFFWLGCDSEQKSCVDLFNALRSIDQYFQEQLNKNADTKYVHITKDNKKEALDKLEYVPLVRESAVPENADKKVEPFDRIKVKFNTKYDKDLPEGQVADITTSLFVGDREEPENLSTVTDFEKFLRWNCEAKFVLQVNKFWAMKAVKNKRRECGLSIKCLQVYITKEAPTSGVSSSERYKKRLFVGGNTTQTTPAAPVKQVPPSKQTAKQDSESEDSESEEEEQQQPVKNTKQTKQVQQESSEEEDSEEEPEQAEANEETEESESEDTPPPPPKKGGKATASKKKQSTDDSEESEEKPKPKGKSSKK
jgi:hypothetical protein